MTRLVFPRCDGAKMHVSSSGPLTNSPLAPTPKCTIGNRSPGRQIGAAWTKLFRAASDGPAIFPAAATAVAGARCTSRNWSMSGSVRGRRASGCSCSCVGSTSTAELVDSSASSSTAGDSADSSASSSTAGISTSSRGCVPELAVAACSSSLVVSWGGRSLVIAEAGVTAAVSAATTSASAFAEVSACGCAKTARTAMPPLV